MPRRPGVYLFRDRTGTIRYIGKAANLRARVRSYFGHDEWRKVGPLLDVLAAIDHVPCSSPMEAAVLEVRLIQQHLPRFNRAATQWPQHAYVRVHGTYTNNRIVATRDTGGEGLFIGPLSSLTSARQAALALREALAARLHADPSEGDRSVTCLVNDPYLLEPLHERMHGLAANERFEDAASLRDRAGALARALDRQRKLDALAGAGTLELTARSELGAAKMGLDPGGVVTIEHSRLVVRSLSASSVPQRLPAALVDTGLSDQPKATVPVEARQFDERWIVAAWFEAHAARLSLVRAERPLAHPIVRRLRFEPLPIPVGRARDAAIGPNLPLRVNTSRREDPTRRAGPSRRTAAARDRATPSDLLRRPTPPLAARRAPGPPELFPPARPR